MADRGLTFEAYQRRLAQAVYLDKPVSTLAYAGGVRLKGLQRLGIETIGDLINHYPFRYNDFSQVVPIALASLQDKSTVLGHIHEVKVKRPRPRLTLIEITLTDDSGMCIIALFNQPWLARQLHPGLRLICHGQMEHAYSYRRMSSPLLSIIDDDDSLIETIQPVYRANSDISQGWLRRFIDQALAHCAGLLDPLPVDLRIRHRLMSRRAALAQVHHPTSSEDCRLARQRLAYEEIFFLQLFLLGRRARIAARAKAQALNVDGRALHALSACLPFTLTDDQSSAVEEILKDLSDSRPMSRLLMGEVGSGKTVVAIHALAVAADSQRQAVMMAPTEVLANQYALAVGSVLDSLGISWALLTSSTPAADRARLLTGLSTGTVEVAFGTHALLEPDVVFANLALVVVDEQHRFGVNQRETIRAKGEAVHYLAMTATPIPRSLALTIYGDLDITTIRSRPRKNSMIKTKVIVRDQLAIAYDAVREALLRKEQAYFVCPLIGQAGQTNNG
ncbi:MAG: DEAD/DEAH box helicase, partial [Coriobacteriales bacterium]|nr:DEAD/DEAH box helicase [Coriobacteriales bacterium]